MHRLGQLVVELLPNAPGEKRNALEEPLDVGIRAAVRKHRRCERIGIAELAPELAQV